MHRRRERWIRTGGGAARPVVLLLHLPCVEAVRGAVQGEAGVAMGFQACLTCEGSV